MHAYQVILLLGSNIGDRKHYLNRSIKMLDKHVGTIKKISSIYETKAWGYTQQTDFLNQAVLLYSAIPPLNILLNIQKIEKSIGRNPTIRWGPRIIDIDIIFYDRHIMFSDLLTLPHKQMHLRNFCLAPICEILPNYTHPILNKTIFKLKQNCTDSSKVHLAKVQ